MADKNYYSIDSYDKLFAKCDGSGTTFVDSSTANPKTITANGNATQLPIKFNKSAGFFNGTTDYVVVPDSNDWDFGTGDFNIEAFFNWTATQTAGLIDGGYGVNKGVSIQWGSNTVTVYLNGVSKISGSWTPTINTWYHLRVKRTGTALKLYLDASEIGSATDSTNIDGGTFGYEIGRYSTQYFRGWIKELRVIKGTSTTVTVPTSEYTATSEVNTVLLMHFDTPATSPLGPAIYFDGTGDYLSYPADQFSGTGDFRLQFFANCTSSTDNLRVLFDSGLAYSKGIGVALGFGATQVINVYLNGGASKATGTIAYTTNRWSHFRVERISGKIYIFQDGRLLNAGGTADTTNVAVDTHPTTIGIESDGAGNPMIGHMREIYLEYGASIVGGTAFTPSQRGETVTANTKLYIKGNENNGVTTFIDSETTPKTISTNGDTKIKYTEDYRSCIFKDETGKFPYPQGSAKVDFFAIGSGVGYFDGTNDSLTVADSADWDMGTGAYTLEAYVRFNSATGPQALFDRDTLQDFSFYIDDTGKLYHNSAAGSMYATWTPLVNTWYHMSFAREDNTSNKARIFVNGVLSATGTAGQDVASDQILYIGILENGSYDFNGLMDNIRISKGVARYMATFNPPEFTTGTNSQIIWVN